MKKLLFSIAIAAMISSCAKDDSPGPPPVSNKPTITGFTPKTGPVGTGVTITGTNFSTTAKDNEVKFGSIAANVSSATSTTIMVNVPVGATTAKISVTVDGKTTTSADNFTVSPETMNQAPEMDDQEFKPLESITDAEEIGEVQASDPNGDTLTFSITDSELFTISDTGILTLAEGKTLDFETEASYTITVSVSDGKESVDATITVSVQDVAEADPKDKAAFVTTWKTEADGEEISFYISDNYAYNFQVNWGDGTVDTIDTTDNYPVDGEVKHTYDTAGDHTVAMYGELPWFVVGPENQNALKLSSMDQWGNNVWQDLSYAFASCSNMVYKATDVPDLSNVTNLSYMFTGAVLFDGDISNWDTAEITNMSYMFAWANMFNRNLSAWDTSKVTDMEGMFYLAESFNGDISGWETKNVINMGGLLLGATSFDQDLGSWDISNVTYMESMLTNSGMSTQNYQSTLLGWSILDEGETKIPQEITLGAIGLTYCNSAGKNTLVNDFAWIINDSGMAPDCF